MKNLQKGDILLYHKSNNFISRIIKFVSMGLYYHSEIYYGNGYSLDVSLKYKKGYKIKKIKEKDIGSIFHVYRPDYHKDLHDTFNHICIELSKMKDYGFFNLFVFIFIRIARKFKLRIFEKDGFKICSELCCNFLVYAGVNQIVKEEEIIPSLLSPNDLPRYFKMDRVF